MASDAGSAMFKAIADFAQLRRESKKSQSSLKDLGDESGKTSKKLGDTETQSEKTATKLGRLGSAMEGVRSKWKDFQKTEAGNTLDRMSLSAGRLIGNMTEVGKKVTALGLVGVFATASLGPVLGLVGAVGALSGAVGVVPGIVGAAAAAGIVMKVAFMGVSDMMKAAAGPAEDFDEAIKGLPAPMQEVAKAARALMPGLRNIKKEIQSKFWDGLAEPMERLAHQYFPIARQQGGKLASTFNEMAKELGGFLTEQRQVKDIDGALTNVNKGWQAMVAAVRPLGQVFVDIFAVSSEFLPGMGKGIAGATQNFADFIRAARESGKLKEWIQTGIDSLKTLGAVLYNIGRIFVEVFSAGSSEGKSFLQTLRTATDDFADFLGSAEGQDSLKSLFSAIADAAVVATGILKQLFSTLADIAPILVRIGEIIGPAVETVIKGIGEAVRAAEPGLKKFATAIAGFLSALGDAGPVIGQFFGGLLDVLSPVLDALTWVVRTLTDLFNALPAPAQGLITHLGGIAAVGLLAVAALGKLAGVVTGVVGAIGKGVSVLNKIPGISLPAPDGGKEAGKGAAKATAGAGGVSLPDMTGKGAAEGDKAGKSFLSRLGSVIKKGGAGIASAVSSVFGGAKSAASASASGLGKAFAWAKPALGNVLKAIGAGIVAMAGAFKALGAALLANPILIVIAAIAAIAILVITNWDTVKQWLATFWEWLKVGFTAIGDFFVWIWGKITGVFTGAWNAIKKLITDGLLLVTTIWNAAWQGISDFFSWIWGLITGVASAVWEALKTAFVAVLDAIKAAWEFIWNGIKAVAEWVWESIKSVIGGAIGAVKDVIDAVLGTIKSIWDAGWKVVSDVVTTVWNAIEDVVSGVVQEIRDLIGGLMDFFSTLWDKAKEVLDWIYERGQDVKEFFTGVRGTEVDIKNRGFRPGRKAHGGQIGGSGNRDSELIRAMPGEYVMPKKQTRENLQLLRAMNPYDHGAGLTLKGVLGSAAAAAPSRGELASFSSRTPNSANGGGGWSGDVIVNQYVSNPLPEKPSETASKRTGSAARIGVLSAIGGSV